MAQNLNYQTPGTPSQWGGDSYAVPVSESSAETRASFIRKTYLHLVGAILVLAGIDMLIFAVVPQSTLIRLTMASGGMAWLLVLGLFMAVSYIAGKWARSGTSVAMQYLGLGVYVLAQALIFVPLLTVATFHFPDSGIIGTAAIVTVLMVAALTAFVFITGADFSFMRGILMICFFGAFALIGASLLFGFTLGVVFMVAMIVLLCGMILYETSNVMHHYLPGQHVAASLALFASVATLFWYVLQLLMSMRD